MTSPPPIPAAALRPATEPAPSLPATLPASAATYLVGIDLGTTNSAVAYAELATAGRQGVRAVRHFAVPQLTAVGTVEPRALLPSAVYIPPASDGAVGALPFDPTATDIVGTFARELGAKIPGRLVVSTKSWLCHAGVDRRSAILPTGAPPDLTRRSPVEVSAQILSHIRKAWDHANPTAKLADQEVVLAVPASFDAAARALTLEAAAAAGIAKHLVLVEEPQAAFYDYFASNESRIREERRDQLVLVVDVGGGTTDLTLIRVGFDDDGAPVLKRLAVGDHLLLGGDNMDMALAKLAEDKLALGAPGTRLEPARWALLVEACRRAKEALLGSSPAERYRVVVPGRSSKLIGGSIGCDLERTEIQAAVVDGFFPAITLDDRPQRPFRSGLAQLGLPYEADAGLTRHIAAFLARHAENGAPVRPDAVLLNGGVFQSTALTSRLFEVLRGAGLDVTALPHGSLDLAVARGAAVYGLVRKGLGTRITGGSARAYYAEVGAEIGKKHDGRMGVCLIPRGHDDLDPIVLKERTFQLRVGRPVEFKLFATSSDVQHRPGDLTRVDRDDFGALPPVQIMLPNDGGRAEIPVLLSAALTDVGVLDVACLAVDRDVRWKLEFDLRQTNPVGVTQEGDDQQPVRGRMGLTTAQEAKAADAIERIFGSKPTEDVKPKDIRQLRETLRLALGAAKEEWSLPMLRGLWELLAPHQKRRRRSADHEAVFFNLAGYFLRPGFGYPLDEWRIKELWQLFQQDVQYHQEDAVWHAWWVTWRRVVGGLDAAQQKQLLQSVRGWLRPTTADANNNKKSKRQVKGQEEMLRLVGSLERLDPAAKADWGAWLLGELEAGRGTSTTAWTLARLGARVPFSGAAMNIVDSEIVEGWLERLLALPWKKVDNAAFAAGHLARRTDDRLRDVAPDLRARVADALEKNGDADLALIVRQAVALEAKGEDRFVGDTLPPGLTLLSDVTKTA